MVVVKGSGHATDTIALHDRPDPSRIPVVGLAASRAFAQAGVSARDIDFCEVHDCFTIAELCCLEEMGFYEAGRAGKATLAGETALGGKLPVNPSGGLLSGNPNGVAGMARVAEAVLQLRGQAGKRQVPGAKIALAHGVTGICGQHQAVMILGKK